MVESLIKLVRQQIWKFRFMLYWRTLVLAILYVLLIFWLFSPMILGMYLAKSPFQFLVLLCLASFYINISLMGGSHDSGVVKLGDRLLEECKELKYLIRDEKHNLRAMKRKES